MQINNKQTILIASFALVLVLIAMPLVFAEENATNVTENGNQTLETNQTLDNETEDANQTLDNETIGDINDDLNESVSSWDINWKRISILFTLNQEKKIKKEFDLARLELIRARIFAKNNNGAAMEKALEAHDRIIAKIQKRIESLDGASTKNETRKSAEKLVGLDRAIQVHEARIQKLKDLIANDLNLTAEQIANIQEKIAKAENNTEHLKDVQEAKMEKIKTKLMAVGNMSEDEAEDEIHELEDAQNLSEVKKRIAEKRLSKAEERLEDLNEKLSDFQEEGKNTTAIELKIAEYQSEMAKEAKEKGREQAREKDKSNGKSSEDEN